MIVADDNVASTALDSNTSSSAISAPAENGKSHDLITVQNLNEFLKFYPKSELVHTNIDKENKQLGLSKNRACVELSKSTLRSKSLESKKRSNHSTSTSSQSTTKQQRKCDNPVRLSITECSDNPSVLYCENSACKAILSPEDTFCRKCSCCICHLFDDNKDPTLWLVCTAGPSDGYWCGMSSHIECALQQKKAGVVDNGHFMQLDGSYCCSSCGKVSGIIGCWKQQLAVAKDANQVGILCYRISLSYRLLYGTSKFKELHQIIEDATKILEPEVGHVSGVSPRIARGDVSKLSVASDVQKRCFLAIEKAEARLKSVGDSNTELNSEQLYFQNLKQLSSLADSHTACSVRFEEVSSSSLVIVLNEPSSSELDAIKGYKLWYCKSTESMYERDPVLIPRVQQRILVSNLQSCTDYVFRIVSFSDDDRDLGYTELKCFTGSRERIHRETKQTGTELCSSGGTRMPKNPDAGSPGFKVRSLGSTFGPAWVCGQDSLNELYQEDDVEEGSYTRSGTLKLNNTEEDQPKASVPRHLDLNVATVPDLNADLSPPIEPMPEENSLTFEKNCLDRSNGVRDSLLDSRWHSANGLVDACDGDSTLVSAPPQHELSTGTSQLDDNFEHCVKVIRWLECSGHIGKDFRMRFLTWFSLRSTEKERWVVVTFIKTLIEEPSCLAGQLLDTFLETVNCKRPRNGFCSKLWH